ncbi:MAG TPA: ester cyclase [Ktedonobacterales bacterium]
MANDKQEIVAANKASVKRLADELSRGNLGTFDAIMAPGYIAHNGSDTLILNEVKGEYSTLLHAFPDGSWTPELMLSAEGDTIVTTGTFRGTQGDEYAGIGASGQHVAIPFIWIHRFSGGTIREGWALRDELALVQQIGGQIVPD